MRKILDGLGQIFSFSNVFIVAGTIAIWHGVSGYDERAAFIVIGVLMVAVALVGGVIRARASARRQDES